MNFDKIKDAVNSIEMSDSMKYRLIKNCNGIEKEKVVHLNYKRWISAVCVFAILLSIIIGIPYINKNGDLLVANFAITAYAVGVDGQLNKNLSSEKAMFDLSTQDRIGLVDSIGGDGANLVFTDVTLKITGEDIDSVTYTINKGKFIEDVTLTAEENADRDWLLAEKIYIIYGASNSDIIRGIKEIGNTYTVMYNEQDKYEYTLAIPHDGNYIIEETIINVNVKYTDGNTEQQDIIVTQDSDSISLELK